jgi:hypothetical protein
MMKTGTPGVCKSCWSEMLWHCLSLAPLCPASCIGSLTLHQGTTIYCKHLLCLFSHLQAVFSRPVIALGSDWGSKELPATLVGCCACRTTEAVAVAAGTGRTLMQRLMA